MDNHIRPIPIERLPSSIASNLRITHIHRVLETLFDISRRNADLTPPFKDDYVSINSIRFFGDTHVVANLEVCTVPTAIEVHAVILAAFPTDAD